MAASNRPQKASSSGGSTGADVSTDMTVSAAATTRRTRPVILDCRRSRSPESPTAEPPVSEQPLLELEVALDRRDGQALGRDVDGVHAAPTEDRERPGTGIAHLLRHDLLEQLRR